MSFDYDGLHLMIDAVVEDGKKLTDGSLGEKMIEEIVSAIDMTMILPPVTVKFPHSTCEMQRVLEDLKKEGLGDSSTALLLDKRLKERREESYGYSTFAMIAESHLSIHTFPELGYFSFDCYSCKTFDVEAVISSIKNHFAIRKIEVQTAKRRVPKAEPVICETEHDDHGTSQKWVVKNTLFSKKTQFQQCEILDLEALGRCLVLDGVLQVSEYDTERYHEAMAHIPLSEIDVSSDPKFLIVGGGDGALAHELLKYNSAKVYQFDIDAEVCAAAKEHLSVLHRGSFDNSRFYLYHTDVFKTRSEHAHEYDAIFLDLTDDRYESTDGDYTPATGFLTTASLLNLKSWLKPGGTIVIQADNPDFEVGRKEYSMIHSVFTSCFGENVSSFVIPSITYGSSLAFVYGRDGAPIAQEFNKFIVDRKWLTSATANACVALVDEKWIA